MDLAALPGLAIRASIVLLVFRLGLRATHEDALYLYLLRIARRMADVMTYRSYRQDVARALMLGLEILVAADIIRTVALAPTLQNVLILGLLVVVRTFLSWGLVVEIEERWPWQSPRVERTAHAEPTDKE
jgi:uncharacterized membrane protein